MDHSFAACVALPSIMVGHIVAMRKPEPPCAPHLGDSSGERARHARRVHEHVALQTANEIARRSERGLRREPTIKNVAGHELWEGPRCLGGAPLADGPNRARWAGNEGHQGPAPRLFV